MSVDEELHEHAEHAKDPFDKNVALSMAMIAAALAVVTVLGHIFANEELLAQQKASDQWAFYQAKSIRRYESDIAKDILATLIDGNVTTEGRGSNSSGPAGKPRPPVAQSSAPAATVEKYAANQERYEKEGEEIQNDARKLEEESGLDGRKALRFHTGEVFLEIGIVLASLAILTKRRVAWVAAIASAGIGVVIAGTFILVR
jgi:hypothetical protein